MAKKMVKKTKIKLVNLLIIIAVLAVLSFAIYLVLQIPVKNIVIKNTNYLNDDYILELAGIKDYPKFILTSSRSVQKKLEKSNYINSAKLHKKLFFV